jgi:hypothetical protein
MKLGLKFLYGKNIVWTTKNWIIFGILMRRWLQDDNRTCDYYMSRLFSATFIVVETKRNQIQPRIQFKGYTLHYAWLVTPFGSSLKFKYSKFQRPL